MQASNSCLIRSRITNVTYSINRIYLTSRKIGPRLHHGHRGTAPAARLQRPPRARHHLSVSLSEREEQWYTRTIGNLTSYWEELRDDFCCSFSLTEHIDSLPIGILDFEQLEKESIGAAWARFLRLLVLAQTCLYPRMYHRTSSTRV